MGNSNKKALPITSERKQFSSLLFAEQAPQSIASFFKESPTKNIGSLSLNSCHIGPKGVQIMTRALWPHLTNLKMHQCRIENAGVHHLIKIQSNCLKNLNILGNGINDEGCATLKKGNWELKHLTINQKNGSEKRPNKITLFGLKHILVMPIVNKHQILETKEYNYWPQILEEPDLI